MNDPQWVMDPFDLRCGTGDEVECTGPGGVP